MLHIYVTLKSVHVKNNASYKNFEVRYQLFFLFLVHKGMKNSFTFIYLYFFIVYYYEKFQDKNFKNQILISFKFQSKFWLQLSLICSCVTSSFSEWLTMAVMRGSSAPGSDIRTLIIINTVEILRQGRQVP